MVRASADILIERPAEPVFTFVVLEFFQNYQRWSPEVECLDVLSPGPIGIGSAARQVRVDQGRRTDTTFEVVALHPLQGVEFLEVENRYRIRYALAPVAPKGALSDPTGAHTLLTFSVQLKPLSLLMRPFEPMIQAVAQAGAEQVVQAIKELVEAQVPGRSRRTR